MKSYINNQVKHITYMTKDVKKHTDITIQYGNVYVLKNIK